MSKQINNSHFYPLKIFYEDTDSTGVVYHANYVKFMERARTCFLYEKGLSLPALIDTFGIQFLVRGIKIDYVQPARLLQNIIVVTNLIKIGRASLSFLQQIYFEPSDMNTMICRGEVNIVCTNLQYKPCAIPLAVLTEFKD